MNFLDPNNCNKAKCKTCIFGDTPIELSPERIEEIRSYLINFEASHVCHTTDKTCYGALEFQSKVLYAAGIIEVPTVNAFLQKAKTILNI